MLLVRLVGPSGVTVTTAPGQGCGTIEPTIVGLAEYDGDRREVRMTIAIHNAGILQVHAPAAVVARQGSLQSSPGVPASGRLRFVTADSGTGDSTSATGTRRWSFDRLLHRAQEPAVVAQDGEFVIPPNDTSDTRTIAVAVPPDVTAFQVTLVALGTNLFTVPAEPPARVSADELEDSRAAANLVRGDRRFPGRVVRNKLWLLFRSAATIEQRQAALDAVQGVVIGGAAMGPSRYYYVRIPANPDSGAGPLERAIRALAPLPQVQHVMADHPDRPGITP